MKTEKGILKNYGGLIFDKKSKSWGLWCSNYNGYYIGYSSLKLMYQDIRTAIRHECEKIESGVAQELNQ